MRNNLRNTLLIAINFLPLLSKVNATESNVFTWENSSPVIQSNLQGTLEENNWYARSVQRGDLKFYQSLFGNELVMKQFGTGQVRTPEYIEGRINFWSKRFQDGKPHGGLTVLRAEDNTLLGHAIAGGGDEAGASEIAYLYAPDAWGKGIASNVVKQIVKVWAPEVRRIGLGINLDEQKDAQIISNFKCFIDQPLQRLDATASPANIGSWKVLTKNGFHRAYSRTSDDRQVIEVDEEQYREAGKVNYEKLETQIIAKYFDSSVMNPLKEGVRYLMIDPEGNERTLSKHQGFAKLKYHFEYNLTQ